MVELSSQRVTLANFSAQLIRQTYSNFADIVGNSTSFPLKVAFPKAGTYILGFDGALSSAAVANHTTIRVQGSPSMQAVNTAR